MAEPEDRDALYQRLLGLTPEQEAQVEQLLQQYRQRQATPPVSPERTPRPKPPKGHLPFLAQRPGSN